MRSVRIGEDSIVEPFAQILGRTEIGEDCRIGACSIVRDSTLADGVEIAPFTYIVDSHIETGAHHRTLRALARREPRSAKTRASGTSWN